MRFGQSHLPERRPSGAGRRGAAGRAGRVSTSSASRTTPTSAATSTPSPCWAPWPRPPSGSGCSPTWPACPCGPRRCWPRRPPRSTCCPGAGSSWALARARSGTRSSPWAAPAAPRARPWRRWRRPSGSCGCSGATSVRPASRGGTTGWCRVKPGPAPGHRIGIWVGAFGPRMLSLIGRLADGWVPSSTYVPPQRQAHRPACGPFDAAATRATTRDPPLTTIVVHRRQGRVLNQPGDSLLSRRRAAGHRGRGWHLGRAAETTACQLHLRHPSLDAGQAPGQAVGPLAKGGSVQETTRVRIRNRPPGRVPCRATRASSSCSTST